MNLYKKINFPTSSQFFLNNFRINEQKVTSFYRHFEIQFLEFSKDSINKVPGLFQEVPGIKKALKKILVFPGPYEPVQTTYIFATYTQKQNGKIGNIRTCHLDRDPWKPSAKSPEIEVLVLIFKTSFNMN